MARQFPEGRLCDTCSKDIEHLNSQRRFCSVKCQRRGSERTVYVSGEVYEMCKAEAQRRGIPIKAFVELALMPSLSRGGS